MIDDAPWVTTKKFKKMLEVRRKDFIILDLRAEVEKSSAKFKDAWNFEMNEIMNRKGLTAKETTLEPALMKKLKLIKEGKDAKEIIIHCKSGNIRSPMFTNLLVKQGY